MRLFAFITNLLHLDTIYLVCSSGIKKRSKSTDEPEINLED